MTTLADMRVHGQFWKNLDRSINLNHTIVLFVKIQEKLIFFYIAKVYVYSYSEFAVKLDM